MKPRSKNQKKRRRQRIKKKSEPSRNKELVVGANQIGEFKTGRKIK
jgi:hypothetical protein